MTLSGVSGSISSNRKNTFMGNSTYGEPATPEEFVATILGREPPTDTAAFAAAISGRGEKVDTGPFAAALLGKEKPSNTAEFAAAIREYNPDEPRDEKGRWTTGGSPVSSPGDSSGNGDDDSGYPYTTSPGDPPSETSPSQPPPSETSPGEQPPSSGRSRFTPKATSPGKSPPEGTKENGYNGLGKWGDFKTEQEFVDFLERLLRTKENKYPAGWEKLARRGCIGLNMLRIGWADRGHSLWSPFLYPDAEYYADRGAAEARLRQLQGDKSGKEWLFVAAQMPLSVPTKGLVKDCGSRRVSIPAVLRRVSDENQSHYNFATFFPSPGGSGYWEFMNHESATFDPADPPCVYHRSDLPKSLSGVKAENVITLYGVVSKEPWKK